MSFAELHCISNFSFLRGASHPEELVQQAIKEGYRGIAITDECSVAGVVKAWNEIQKHRLKHFKLIIGSEFQSNGHCFVVLCQNRKGYGELCRLITGCRRRAEKGQYIFKPEDLLELQHCLLLWHPKPDTPSQIPDELTALIKHFSQRLWLLLEQHLVEQDFAQLCLVESLSQKLKLPIVASNYAHMHHPDRKMLHDAVTAIRLNSPVSQIASHLKPNAEHHLRSLQKLKALHKPEHLSESLNIIDQCSFELSELHYQYPEESVPQGFTAKSYLRKVTYEGAHTRYPDAIPDSVKALIEKELRIIDELNYEYYFLTIYDIVKYARSIGILCQGRGSAANSVVCYCLRITEVDPTKASLLFERFISKRRNEPPDIDVDFENARREEVIQYIYERYGRDRCAIAATVITYRAKSAVRDLGKALGVDLMQLENVIANYGWRYRGKDWIDEVITPQISQNNHTLSCMRTLLPQLLGFPRHLSQHVGGFVISQGPLIELVPIENAAMENRTVIQWDKEDLESLQLMKVDVLALGMLTAIRKTLEYISERKGYDFTMADIPKDGDDKVYGMLQKADTVGLFQVESRAQMNMLPRLRPEKYYDLVVQVAIVRPGPIHGDMVHPYLKGKNEGKKQEVPLKELTPILARTFGVPIFQEQVIAIAMVGADFTADEAEDLRRSMASWKKQGHMNQLRTKLTERLLGKGVNQDYIDRLCRQIEGFGEYGFPESHAASFALLAYISAWLKYYYPAAFLCGLLNSQPMGFYRPWQLVQDAQRHGVIVMPVDINHSHWDHQLQPHQNSPEEGALRLGFRSVKGLSQHSANTLTYNRPEQGYQTMNEVMNLPGISREDLEALASANAFQGLGKHRYQQRWEASAHHFYNQLFMNLEPPSQPLSAPNRLDEIIEEHSSTGVILNDHPMAYLREHSILEDCVSAEDLYHIAPEKEIYVAGVVINRQRPGTSAGVTFVTLEDETGSINVIVWLQTALNQMKDLVKARLLKVYGKVDKDAGGEVIHVVAYKLFDLTHQLMRLESRSRDFH
ncbi:error-prone DNA polymerase [Hahella ganghwensis]|uniref:error-prone DNA polymerase n=1 Tax=Hahella ganghwensis TaxID=286420 RepID=UPI00036AEB74|nr:error-prone DNA polymerase [Hahella ganghwensis]